MFDDAIYGIEYCSFSDWHGKICTVLFIGGCNFRCPTCHNKEIVFNYNNLKPYEFDSVIQLIEKNKNWIDGICISGGEPTNYKNIKELIKEIVLISPIKVDTNGYNIEVIRDILPYISILAVDIKGPFNKYSELTGINIEERIIKEKFNELFKLAGEYTNKFYFRTTLVPELSKSDLEELTSQIPNSFSLHLQKYINRG